MTPRQRYNTKWWLLMMQGSLCGDCGRGLDFATATFDHIIPRSKGGGSWRSNLRILCYPCNIKKGDTVPESVVAPHGPLTFKLGSLFKEAKC